MKNNVCSNKLWLITVFFLVFALSSSDAFAKGKEDKPHGRQREVVTVGHQKYNYHDGKFYRPWWFGFELIINSPPLGAVIRSLPFGHKTIIVAGVPYYCYDNVYYKPSPIGYVVVPQPVITSNITYAAVTTKPQALTVNAIVINVPNLNGSYTPVTLVRYNDGYLGPQGEYYPSNPTVDQLRVLYGR
jgi:hypothetical protein